MKIATRLDNELCFAFSYRSAFQDTFEAFTRNPLWDLKTFRGETVCFRNLVFPLLPRMIFGLFYNTPLVLALYIISPRYSALQKRMLIIKERIFFLDLRLRKIRIVQSFRRSHAASASNTSSSKKRSEDSCNIAEQRHSVQKNFKRK